MTAPPFAYRYSARLVVDQRSAETAQAALGEIAVFEQRVVPSTFRPLGSNDAAAATESLLTDLDRALFAQTVLRGGGPAPGNLTIRETTSAFDMVVNVVLFVTHAAAARTLRPGSTLACPHLVMGFTRSLFHGELGQRVLVGGTPHEQLALELARE